jgi:thiamine biosynthesis lipoprotein
VPDGIRDAVLGRVERFDLDWSRFRPDSTMTRIASAAGRHRLPADAGPLLALYRELFEATSGRVSPLVGRTLEALGYDPAFRLRPSGIVPPVPAWDDAVRWDGAYLETVAPTLLDVGAAGKGYLVDLVSDLLTGAGLDRHVIDASGDLVARGVPLRVALENPRNPASAVGLAQIDGGALCASASNRRAWGDLHHVLDAVTGLPTRQVLATWAAAPSALVADGAATALFFEVDRGFLRRHGIEFARMTADGRIERSAGFPGEVFA